MRGKEIIYLTNSCRSCVKKRVWQGVTIDKRRPFFFLFSFFFFFLFFFSSSSTTSSFLVNSKSCFPVSYKLHFRWMIWKGRSYYRMYVGNGKQWAFTCIHCYESWPQRSLKKLQRKEGECRIQKTWCLTPAPPFTIEANCLSLSELHLFCFLFNLQHWLISLTYLTQLLWGSNRKKDVNASWKL